MPSYIRLLGDSAKNNVEVRNTFKEPVLIPANAKVALTGVNAVLADDLGNERYTISGTAGQFNIGLTGGSTYQANAVIPNADYTSSTFVDAFETAANYSAKFVTETTGTWYTLLGLHHEIDLVDSKLQIKTFKADLAAPDFDDAIWIDFEAPAAAKSADGFTATATAASETVLLGVGIRVPLVSSQFTAQFVNANTIDMELGACGYDSPARVYWGIRTVSAQYQYGVMNSSGTVVWNDIADVLAEANDVVTLWRWANNIRIKIVRADASQAALISYEGISRAQADTSKDLIVWYVRAATNGQMSNCLATEIVGGNPPALGGLNTTINAAIQFVTATGAFNSILAVYAGFTGERNIVSYKGDPATLNSRFEAGGLPAYPGVLICLDGMGLLRSYDGAATAKSPANIIYSLSELQNKSQYLQLDIPEPLYLDIGNAKEINVNELRIRLFEAGGYNPLTFIGNPSFSLMVQYP